MRRQIAVSFLLVASLSLVGCKKDEQVNSALAEFDSFTTELLARIETAANPSAGLDDAQKYFDSKKAELITKMAALKGVREYQVSEETKQKMALRLVEDASKVGNLQIKYDSQSINDPLFKAKLDKLVKDYQALLTE
jgi:hypothetical protein